ncbi:MAG: hypothetical protein PHN89_03890 [Candidatus Pacebacteria bacterium]|nr:hypothetical protein [Candidatus Paceibacterota bacterium]
MDKDILKLNELSIEYQEAINKEDAATKDVERAISFKTKYKCLQALYEAKMKRNSIGNKINSFCKELEARQ